MGTVRDDTSVSEDRRHTTDGLEERWSWNDLDLSIRPLGHLDELLDDVRPRDRSSTIWALAGSGVHPLARLAHPALQSQIVGDEETVHPSLQQGIHRPLNPGDRQLVLVDGPLEL